MLRQHYSEKEVTLERFESFNTRNAVVWVDPLDGTKDFVNGRLQSVTVLIGLCIDEHSRFGIVHNPFGKDDGKTGQTFFGSAEHGCFYMPFDYTLPL